MKLKNARKLFVTGVSSFLLAPTFSWADTPIHVENDGKGTIASLTFQDCGPGDPAIEARLEKGDKVGTVQNQVLALDIGHFQLSGSNDERKSSDCFINARVRIPAGKRLRINGGSAYGTADIQGNSQGALGFARFTYESAATNDLWEATETFSSGQGQQIALEPEQDHHNFSPCSSNNQILELNSALSLTLDQFTGPESSLRMISQGQGYGIGWNWGWEDCFSGSFQSEYIAYNGQPYSATINIDGDSGVFESEAGFVGQFSNIHREGSTITGQWSAMGKSGWFRFEADDYDAGIYHGSWGATDSPLPAIRWDITGRM